MSDYCLPVNQIGNYQPSTSGGTGDTLTVRNIDCMSLDSYQVTATELTVDGFDISVDVPALTTKTQHQTATASPIETTFTGSVKSATMNAPYAVIQELQTTGSEITISSNVTSGNLSTTGPIAISNTGTSSLSLMNLLQPNLGAGAKAYMLLGKSNTTSNAGELSFVYTSSGSTSNYIQLGLVNGTNNIRVYNGTTQINGTVYANAEPINAYSANSMTSTTAATNAPVTFSVPSTFPNPRYITFTFSNLGIATSTTPSLKLVSSGSVITPVSSGTYPTYSGLTGGNNGGAGVTWLSDTSANHGVLLHNSTSLPSTNCRLTGQVMFTWAGTYTAPQQIWSVSGYTMCIKSDGTRYYTCISGIVYMTDATKPLLTGVQLAVGSNTTGAILASSQYTIVYN